MRQYRQQDILATNINYAASRTLSRHDTTDYRNGVDNAKEAIVFAIANSMKHRKTFNYERFLLLAGVLQKKEGLE